MLPRLLIEEQRTFSAERATTVQRFCGGAKF
jgi:hypothetical protein